MAPRPDASEISPSAPSPVTEVLPAHVKDAQNTTIVPLKSDAVSKDQVQGNGDSDFKAPDAKVVSKKSKSSSKKTLGPENKTTEQEKVEGDLKKDQEKSSDHKKSSKEAGEVKKKGKESGEAVKSKGGVRVWMWVATDDRKDAQCTVVSVVAEWLKWACNACDSGQQLNLV